MFGVGCGLLAARAAAARALPGSPTTSGRSTGSASRSSTYGVASLPPHGNGLIAVFVVRDRARHPPPRHARRSSARADDIVEIVKLGVFVVFGSLMTLDGLFGDGWAAVAIVVVTLLIARPVAIWVALAGTRAGTARRRSWPGSAPRAWRR